MARPYYASDLAFIHDAGFGDFARRATPGLIALLKRAAARRVVELGCGSGAATAALAAAGFDVLGLDASPAMLRLARRRVPAARLRVARLPRAALPPCDAVVAVGEVLNYMGRRADFPVLFRRVFRALRPDGVFIFDAKLRGPAAGPTTRGRAARDWAVLSVVTEDGRGRGARDIVSFRRVGRLWRRAGETHRLTLPTPAGLARALRSAGFSARRTPGYGAFRVPDGHAVYVARKPA